MFLQPFLVVPAGQMLECKTRQAKSSEFGKRFIKTFQANPLHPNIKSAIKSYLPTKKRRKSNSSSSPSPMQMSRVGSESLLPVCRSVGIVQGLNSRERAHLSHYCGRAIFQTPAVSLACRVPLPRSWQQILLAITDEGPWSSGGRPLILQPAPSPPRVRVPSVL